MARRERSTTSSTPTTSTEAVDQSTTEESNVTTTTEAPVDTDATPEQSDAEPTTPDQGGDQGPTPGPDSGTEAQPAAAPVDLGPFTTAAESSLAQADETTGELPLVALQPIQVEYSKLDPKGKAQARKLVDQRMKQFMTQDDIKTARTYLHISQNLSTGAARKESGPATPADPTEAFVQKAAGLRLALNLATATVPEGVGEGWADKARETVAGATEQATAYAAWLANEAEDKGDAPETPAWVQNAVKLAAGKSARVGGTRSASTGGGTPHEGPRRDVAKHIQNAFADVEPGTFLLISEIRTKKSEEYGDDLPSAGAISARLFPSSGKVTVEGVTPDTRDGKKGAVKA